MYVCKFHASLFTRNHKCWAACGTKDKSLDELMYPLGTMNASMDKNCFSCEIIALIFYWCIEKESSRRAGMNNIPAFVIFSVLINVMNTFLY